MFKSGCFRVQTRRFVCAASAVVVALAVMETESAAGPTEFQEIFLVDFEELPELTVISDQFASLGVLFSMADGSPDGPIIAVVGNPRVAFSGTGTDSPMASGIGGLTDAIVDGDAFAPGAIRMDFSPPVTGVRFFVADIDGGDVVTATAFDGTDVVGTQITADGDPSTGNGVNTEFSIAADSITSVIVEVENPTNPTTIGWAMDFLTFTRPCPDGTCGPRVRVAQESAPGAGDFGANILGEVVASPWGGTAATFYGYNIPEGDSWNGPLTLEADRSHLLFANTEEGVTMVMVHDRAIPNDPDGGRAEMRVDIMNDPDGVTRTVEDDPDSPQDVYTGAPGDSNFTTIHNWDPCCSDGWALSGLDCGALAFVSFDDVNKDITPPSIQGMSEWVVFSADGSTITLALEEGRRVAFQILPDAACAPDLDCDDDVDLNDLLLILASWGPCAPCLADIDGDGIVGFQDLVALLSDWGDC